MKKETIHIAICADVHKDIMHDADERLQTFINSARKWNADFIIQLGDFCRPYSYNRSFMDIWESYEGHRYHVIGNHDMRGGFTKEKTMAYWALPSKYYSFDQNGFHFIILDGNDQKEPPKKGYAKLINEKQKEWLIQDLSETKLATIIFSHQSLMDGWGVVNAHEIRVILEKENKRNKKKKVIACFNGHNHYDSVSKINGIWYIQINSISNQWIGKKYQHIRYDEEVDKKFPWIKFTAPYKDPIFALVTIDKDGLIKIEGAESEWVGPSPQDLGVPFQHLFPSAQGTMEGVVPKISDKILNYAIDHFQPE